MVLMAILVDEAGPAGRSVITYVNPVIAVALGVVFLGEDPGAGALFGLAAILAGSWLATAAGRATGPGAVRADLATPRNRLDFVGMSTATARKIRVVVAKPGLDGHDRGAKIIARALRDAGMEVIYTGLHQTPEQIAETVIQEDADAVGLSILSGAHMTLVPKVVELLKEQGVDDVLVTVGGTIPADDIPELKRLGVAEVFTPGAGTDEIVEFVRDGRRRAPRRGA